MYIFERVEGNVSFKVDLNKKRANYDGDEAAL